MTLVISCRHLLVTHRLSGFVHKVEAVLGISEVSGTVGSPRTTNIKNGYCL